MHHGRIVDGGVFDNPVSERAESTATRNGGRSRSVNSDGHRSGNSTLSRDLSGRLESCDPSSGLPVERSLLAVGWRDPQRIGNVLE